MVSVKQRTYVCRYKFTIHSDQVPSLPHFLQVCFLFKSLARLRGTCSSRYFLASCILSTGITSGDTPQPQGEEKCARVDLLRLGLRGGLSDLQVGVCHTDAKTRGRAVVPVIRPVRRSVFCFATSPVFLVLSGSLANLAVPPGTVIFICHGN